MYFPARVPQRLRGGVLFCSLLSIGGLGGLESGSKRASYSIDDGYYGSKRAKPYVASEAEDSVLVVPREWVTLRKTSGLGICMLLGLIGSCLSASGGIWVWDRYRPKMTATAQSPALNRD